MNIEKKKNREKTPNFLKRKTALPHDALAGEFRLEIRGKSLLFMQGCRRILKYSPEEMVFAVKGVKVIIVGGELICSTYHDGTVSVEGVISAVSFGEVEV